MNCKIENSPAISAIYYALLQSGYEYYSFERPEDFCCTIRSYIGENTVPSFFAGVKQNTCDVYPYWPRAAILETATFFLNEKLDGFKNFDVFKNHIISAANISQEEKGSPLWGWIPGFPAALRDVVDSDCFDRYMKWESEWISDQNRINGNELDLLDGILSECRRKYHPSCQNIQIVLNPIKCIYSSDFHIDGSSFIFTSGGMRIDSVVHEYLHTVVHPVIKSHIILTEKRQYPGIDESYYLDRSEQGYQNAFEEYAVRALTDKVMKQKGPSDLSAFLKCLA